MAQCVTSKTGQIDQASEVTHTAPGSTYRCCAPSTALEPSHHAVVCVLSSLSRQKAHAVSSTAPRSAVPVCSEEPVSNTPLKKANNTAVCWGRQQFSVRCCAQCTCTQLHRDGSRQIRDTMYPLMYNGADRTNTLGGGHRQILSTCCCIWHMQRPCIQTCMHIRTCTHTHGNSCDGCHLHSQSYLRELLPPPATAKDHTPHTPAAATPHRVGPHTKHQLHDPATPTRLMTGVSQPQQQPIRSCRMGPKTPLLLVKDSLLAEQ